VARAGRGRGRPSDPRSKLGDEDGLDLVRALREKSDLPIIVLTGHLLEVVDRIVGIELGADDYLTKPSNP
jgi:two-component system OmpR family response regulator